MKNKDYYILLTEAIICAKESKINSPKSPHNNKKTWLLELSNGEKIKILPDILEDKYFLKMIEDGEFYGKIFSLRISKRGKFLIKATKIEKNENLDFYSYIFNLNRKIKSIRKEIEIENEKNIAEYINKNYENSKDKVKLSVEKRDTVKEIVSFRFDNNSKKLILLLKSESETN